MNTRLVYLCALFALLSLMPLSLADERLQGVACRSVHLVYPAARGVAFYNEMTIDHSAVGSYFMVCGWNKGYFGMQELSNGKKLLLFSVWDSNQNNPKGIKEEDRVKLIHKDAKVRIGRFGGEGTGGQSFFDYDWKVGTTYRFLVTARIDNKRTEYAGYFFVPETKAWKHLVTFSTITGGQSLQGYYSFVEDFKRDKISTTRVRKAHFGNGWVKTTDDKWVPLTRARFTADNNPVTNIDAEVDGQRFVLATGGKTANKGTKLRAFMDCPPTKDRPRPADLPKP